jgi:uncharacterized Fe-S cluster-containing MiaB family protein
MSRNASIRPLARPADRLLFAPTRDRYGVRLALVFGNHAPGGRCPYYVARECRHCDIGAGEGAAVTSELNRQRLAWFQEHYRQILPEVVHLVLYNSGSVLNPQEMPAELLDEILVWARLLPVLRIVSVETRENAVTELSVRRVADTLGPGHMTRLILGLETSNDHRREEVLGKRMPRAAVQRAIEAAGSVAADLGTERIGLTFNILVGGPGTNLQTAVDDALATAHFALEAGRVANISVDLNLHPYYRSTRGRSHFPAHPRCSPQTVALVACAIAERVAPHAPPTALFIGTADEGNDKDSIPLEWRADAVHVAFAKFNQTQDSSVLNFLFRTKTLEEVSRGG